MDIAGNGGQYFTSSFATNDNVPPFVSDGELYVNDEEWLILNGAETLDRTPYIYISYGDATTGINFDSIVFTLDGQTISNGVYPWGIQYEPETPLSYGQHTITIQLADLVGNLTPLKTETFSVLKDPRTPFAVESDTTLLWRLDEADRYDSRITPDAGDYLIHGVFPPVYNLAGQKSAQKTEQKSEQKSGLKSADSQSFELTQRGRFGGAVSNPELTSISDEHIASLGNGGFTVEGWLKTSIYEATVPYTVWAKGSGSAKDFELLLTPTGNLIARLYNSNNESVEIEMPKESYDVTDEQWHSLAMTVEADGNIPNQLKLYVDGQLRVGLPVPQNFGTIRNSGGEFYVGFGSYSYYSMFDEIRISSTAHSADTISKTYNSAELGLVVTRINASLIPSGNTSELIIEGYNLDSATSISFTDLDGNPVPINATITENYKTKLKVNVAVDASVPNGDVRLSVTDGQTVAFRDIRIAAQQSAVADPGTLMLFNLNEPDGVSLSNSGTLGGSDDYPTSYEAVNGRFGNGRAYFTTNRFNLSGVINSTFTTEFWIKTTVVDEDANLMVYGTDYDGLDTKIIALNVSNRGELKAVLTDSNELKWEAATQIGQINLFDDQWHLVSMVVTRNAQPEENTLKIYVDGSERASSGIPAGFGSLNGSSAYQFFLNRFRYESNPGSVDDFRFLSYARSASEIQNSWLGVNTLSGVGLLLPKRRDQVDKPANTSETKATQAIIKDFPILTEKEKSEAQRNRFGEKKSSVKEKLTVGEK